MLSTAPQAAVAAHAPNVAQQQVPQQQQQQVPQQQQPAAFTPASPMPVDPYQQQQYAAAQSTPLASGAPPGGALALYNPAAREAQMQQQQPPQPYPYAQQPPVGTPGAGGAGGAGYPPQDPSRAYAPSPSGAQPYDDRYRSRDRYGPDAYDRPYDRERDRDRDWDRERDRDRDRDWDRDRERDRDRDRDRYRYERDRYEPPAPIVIPAPNVDFTKVLDATATLKTDLTRALAVTTTRIEEVVKQAITNVARSMNLLCFER
jgi:hypothetical protein